MENKTDLIAFFSAENFFRLKTDEKQRERFESLTDAFIAEFEREPSKSDWQMLLAYQEEMRQRRLAKERAKLEKEANKPLSGGFDSATDHVQRLPAGRYVLTAAQNNTDIDKNFFNSLLHYCEVNNARLLVAKMTYNKRGFQQPALDYSGDDLWYDPALEQYFVTGQLDLGGMFHFIADANVIPTAKNPLVGFDGITPAGIGAIIPASKIALKVSAALKNAKTKILAATGTVTKRNYILRKTGAIASLEHNIGAVFVDTESGIIRHLEQMEGSNGFHDLLVRYHSKGHAVTHGVTALQFGDIHAEKMTKANLDNAIALIDQFKPDNIILHDVLDFSSRNHHNIKDPVFLHIQNVKGNTVASDLRELANVLDAITYATHPYNSNVHIIESNHDLAINTWLKTADFKNDPINGTTYLRCMLALYEHNENDPNEYFNMLHYAYKHIGGGNNANLINFHETDESLILAGVEMGCHGHNGANGSRGSPNQFRSLGIPLNTGHTHSPGIVGPVYTAGVAASLEMGYNIGPSSWAIAHIVTYENGQRQIIFS